MKRQKGYESKEMQLNIVNLGRAQETNSGSRNSVEKTKITNVCICIIGCNFNYE